MATKRNKEPDVIVSAQGQGAAAAAAPAKKHRSTRTKEAAPASGNPPATGSAADSISKLAQAVAPMTGHEQIAALAYSYWEQRGFQGGSPEEDWLRAERELREKALATED
jgi:hypothetical protein